MNGRSGAYSLNVLHHVVKIQFAQEVGAVLKVILENSALVMTLSPKTVMNKESYRLAQCHHTGDPGTTGVIAQPIVDHRHVSELDRVFSELSRSPVWDQTLKQTIVLRQVSLKSVQQRRQQLLQQLHHHYPPNGVIGVTGANALQPVENQRVSEPEFAI